MMDGLNTISPKWGWKWQDILHDLGMRLCDIAHQDFLIHRRTTEDILRAHREGRSPGLPPSRGCPIENDPDRIDIPLRQGVRLHGLVYSEQNALGSGIKEVNDGGLTRFGKVCVERMNKVGMLIDISHCGPQTALDATNFSKGAHCGQPCRAPGLCGTANASATTGAQSHRGERGCLCGRPRPHTTMTHTANTHDLESVMEHFEYMANLVGIDHVGFGPDTMFGDHVGVHHAFAKTLSTKVILGDVSYKEVPYVKGMENPTEAMWNALRWLVKHG